MYGVVDDPKDIAVKASVFWKIAINFLWSYNDLRENLKRKHKFFIDSPVQIYEYCTWDSN